MVYLESKVGFEINLELYICYVSISYLFILFMHKYKADLNLTSRSSDFMELELICMRII